MSFVVYLVCRFSRLCPLRNNRPTQSIIVIFYTLSKCSHRPSIPLRCFHGNTRKPPCCKLLTHSAKSLRAHTTMTEPDELYTLRAQYWLGHYNLAVEEAKSIARRPMNPALKAEREEILNRAYIALGQYDKLSGGTSGKSFLCSFSL